MEDVTRRPSVFIATLGGAPQVVTLALDQLLPRHNFVEVCVIHTDESEGGGIETAVRRLDQAFMHPQPLEAGPGEKAQRVDYRAGDRFYQFTYRRVLIRRQVQEPGQLATAVAVSDVETAANARAAFRTIFQAVRGYKEQRAVLHFCLAGGRKSMAVFGMAAAQLLFTPGDRLWHLVSERRFMDTSAMHDETGAQSQLVAIPFISLSAVNPVIGTLLTSSDPYDVVQAQENYLHLMDLQRKERFLRELDFDEYQILVGVAQGLSNAEIGERLQKPLAESTVANKLTTIYETYLVSITDVPADVTRPSRENLRVFLAAEFGAYFQQRGERLPKTS